MIANQSVNYVTETSPVAYDGDARLVLSCKGLYDGSIWVFSAIDVYARFVLGSDASSVKSLSSSFV